MARKLNNLEKESLKEFNETLSKNLMKKDKDPCVICGGEIADDWGHNPEPVKEYNEGKCCDTCNFTVVIPERIRLSFLA